MAAGAKTIHRPRPRRRAIAEPAGRWRIQQRPRRPRTMGRKKAAMPMVWRMRSASHAPTRPVQLWAGPAARRAASPAEERAPAAQSADRVRGGVGGRVGGQREEEQRGGDQQHEAEDLVEAAVAGWSRDQPEWFHGGKRGARFRSVRVRIRARNAPDGGRHDAGWTRTDEGPGTARATPIIPEPEREKRKVAGVDSGWKPMGWEAKWPLRGQVRARQADRRR